MPAKVIMAHLGRPRDGRTPKFSLAPGRRRRLAGSSVARPVGRRRRRDRRAARAAGLTDGDVLLLENIRFDPRETSKDDAERRIAWPRRWSNWSVTTAPSSPTVSVSCTASRPRSTTWPRCCRITQGDAGGRRGQGARQAHQSRRPSVRGGAWRVQGVRQAGGHRNLAGKADSLDHRWRNVLHVPCRARVFGGHLAAAGR